VTITAADNRFLVVLAAGEVLGSLQALRRPREWSRPRMGACGERRPPQTRKRASIEELGLRGYVIKCKAGAR
jgi:hypothetical protein